MKVKLVAYTNDKELPALAAATCVGKSKSYHAAKVADDETIWRKLYKGLHVAVDSGHLSLLEHISFTWLVSDVSRALTHQLVRHRIASYSQMSQRYCTVNVLNDWYAIPDSIASDPVILKRYKDCMSLIMTSYNACLAD